MLDEPMEFSEQEGDSKKLSTRTFIYYKKQILDIIAAQTTMDLLCHLTIK